MCCRVGTEPLDMGLKDVPVIVLRGQTEVGCVRSCPSPRTDTLLFRDSRWRSPWTKRRLEIIKATTFRSFFHRPVCM